MTRKFLEDFGLNKEQINKILNVNSNDIGKIKRQLETVKSENRKMRQSISNKSVDATCNNLLIEKLKEENDRNKQNYLAELKSLKIKWATEKMLKSRYLKQIQALQLLLSLSDE